ncbi:hypothetical protein [Desulfovibrio litoralis]|uniref:hypothetical protein n=1 Tax=Desulfovibrio litoralis TaxID=466107 RepID=UPI000934A058|nr:hypothetical protein [Desulfovibrio litoralis]
MFRIFVLFCLFFNLLTQTSLAQENIFPSWENIEKGLDLSFLPLNGETTNDLNSEIILLRINPEYNELVLLMESQDGVKRSLSRWLKDYRLFGVMNASMYQADGVSSIGLMRNKEHINNAKISPRLGAFFVSTPRNSSDTLNKTIPFVDILDKNNPKLVELLEKYETVFQNFRILDANGNILWKDRGVEHSMTLLGKDRHGNIYFIFCQTPLNPAKIAEILKLRLTESDGEKTKTLLTALMYVEGGQEAGLLLKTSDGIKKWVGLPKTKIFGQAALSLSLGFLGDRSVPNVLGIKPRLK